MTRTTHLALFYVLLSFPFHFISHMYHYLKYFVIKFTRIVNSNRYGEWWLVLSVAVKQLSFYVCICVSFSTSEMKNFRGIANIYSH